MMKQLISIYVVWKSMLQACKEARAAFTAVISGAFLGELVKDSVKAWARVFGYGENNLKELTLAEFITEFDMTRRLVDGQYCELNKDTNQLFLIE